jgi:Glycosyl transferase family 2
VKLVMTLLARDEADIVDAQIAFHLNAGVDFVIATDHGSTDGTREILESYAREGYLHLIEETGKHFRQAEWVTRMARIAATDFGADWIINSDADEFWWPRGAPLKDILSEIPPRYGTIRGFLRNFVPSGADDGFFAERMTVRLAPRELTLSTPFRVQEKVIHRAHPHVTVTLGNHDAFADGLVDLRGWYPIEILHFPVRTAEQCRRKLEAHWDRATRDPALDPMAPLHAGYTALEAGAVRKYYETLTVDGPMLEGGLANGSLILDTRLRDTLRTLRVAPEGRTLTARGFELPRERGASLQLTLPTLEDDAIYAGEITVGSRWESTAKVERRLDDLRDRIRRLEQSVLAGVRRRAARIAR